MSFIAKALVDEIWIVGKGDNEAEAVQDCQKQIRERISISIHKEVAPNVVLPLDVAEQAPKSLPDGYGLLILERCDCECGLPNSWRFFAVQRGKHKLKTPYWGDFLKFRITVVPLLYSFEGPDCDFEIKLPENSMEFVQGQWVPCECAKYER